MSIERIQVKGLLSFGPDGIDLPLEPLNVIIGPNGSGKSNLLKVLGLLHAAPTSVPMEIMERGEPRGWYWQPRNYVPKASINVTVPSLSQSASFEHALNLSYEDDAFTIQRERIDRTVESLSSPIVQRTSSGKVLLGASEIPIPGHVLPPGLSVLSSPRDLFDLDPTVSSYHLEDEAAFLEIISRYRHMRLHRNWIFGDAAPYRQDQSAGRWGHWLLKHAENLANVISHLSRRDRDKILYYLTRFYDGIVDVRTPVKAGQISLVVEERGGRLIPAARLSDGTLRYLSLLTALLDPELPSLIAIEEPELGLHPDVIYDLAELMVEASTRTQVVVTTHSPTLIDALSDHPSSVIACEKHDGQTHFRRVNPDDLTSWQGDRGLGELWSMGSIGGTRW